MFRSGYSVSLCRSVYRLQVNVYCVTVTGVKQITVNKYIIQHTCARKVEMPQQVVTRVNRSTLLCKT